MNEAAPHQPETAIPADAIWQITQQEIAFLKWLDSNPGHACTTSKANGYFRVGWCRLFDYGLVQDRPGVDGEVIITELGQLVAEHCETVPSSSMWLCITVQQPHFEAGEEGGL